MMRHPIKIFCVFTILMAVLGAFFYGFAAGQEPVQRYQIGVLAIRGKAQCYRQYIATADYLTRKIPHTSFEIVPLDFQEVIPAVRAQQVDFILVNPLLYVDLEVLFGVRRIATLAGPSSSDLSVAYGGVMFTRAGRKDIKTLADLKGKSLMAVDPLSLGGWLAGYEELMRRRIDPFRFFSKVYFGKIEDDVVMAVLAGKADAGMVKTGVLEGMTAEGKIDLDHFSALTGDRFVAHTELHKEYQKEYMTTGHQIKSCTQLYPSWPLAKMRHTDERIAREVAVALLSMERDEYAAVRGGYGGWITPLSYESVHALMRRFGIGVYAGYGNVALNKLFCQYGPGLVALGMLILVIILVAMKMFILNRRVSQSEKKYRELFSNIPSGMAVYKVVNGGEDFLFQEYNHAAEIITGGTLAEVFNKSVKAVFPGVEPSGLFSVFQRVYRTGVPETLVSRYEDKRLRMWVRNLVYKLSET
ncbi:MAG: PhnD/SsuA/transferrin family substrate-binding protein, partial [Candidatus Omnitrophota bacterium]